MSESFAGLQRIALILAEPVTAGRSNFISPGMGWLVRKMRDALHARGPCGVDQTEAAVFDLGAGEEGKPRFAELRKRGAGKTWLDTQRVVPMVHGGSRFRRVLPLHLAQVRG